MAAQPDATLAELQTLLQVEPRQGVSRGYVWRVPHEQGWRRKKACTPLSAPPWVHALRGAHVKAITQRPDVARFHFLDETGLHLGYARQYARAPVSDA